MRSASLAVALSLAALSVSAQPLVEAQDGKLSIPLVKRGVNELTKPDGTVAWDRVQAHMARAQAKFVKGADAFLLNTGEPLFTAPGVGVVGEAELGRRAWDSESDSLEWGGDSFIPELVERDTEDEGRVFAGFRGSGVIGGAVDKIMNPKGARVINNPKYAPRTKPATAKATPTSVNDAANEILSSASAIAAAASASLASVASVASAKIASSISAAAARASSSASKAAASSSLAAAASSSSKAAAAAASASKAAAAAAAAATASTKTGEIGLTNYNSDMLWAGSLAIGTPAKSFIIDFDTGSADLWVPSASCNSPACAPHSKYDSSKSTTSKAVTNKKLSITYGDGSSTTGSVFTDTVTLGGLTATSQQIGAATGLSSDWANDPMDGLMGMGYRSISQMGGEPFFQTLVSQGKVADAQFSFRLGETGSSELYLGGMNPEHFVAGSTQWASVVSQSYWVIAGTANVDSKAKISNFNAIIDSGTSVIVAPTAAAKAFWATVPDSGVYGSGYYTFPCATPPTVSFSFGGATRQWKIAAKDLNLGRVATGSTRCVGAVVGADVGVNAWILGDTLFKNAYITFDLEKNRVGFSTMS